MDHQTDQPTGATDRAGPDELFTSDNLFRAIERSTGRLNALDYATHGLAKLTGADAACLSWIIADILMDLEQVMKEAERLAK